MLPTWHSPSFVASGFSTSSTTMVRVLGAGNAGAARPTTANAAAGTDSSLRHLLSCSSLPAHPWAVVHITNYSTLLLLVLLSTVFGTAISLPEEVPRPYEEPQHPDRQLWRYGLEEKPRDFQVLPRRWVIERTFAWLGQARRLAKDYERLPETALALISTRR